MLYTVKCRYQIHLQNKKAASWLEPRVGQLELPAGQKAELPCSVAALQGVVRPGLQPPDFHIADFYHFSDVFPENKAVLAAVWWITRETEGFCKTDRKTRIDVQFVLEFFI